MVKLFMNLIKNFLIKRLKRFENIVNKFIEKNKTYIFLKKITLSNWKQFAHLHEKIVQSVVLMMGRKVNDISDIPCGNTYSLVAVDEGILKQGTITTSKNDMQ